MLDLPSDLTTSTYVEKIEHRILIPCKSRGTGVAQFPRTEMISWFSCNIGPNLLTVISIKMGGLIHTKAKSCLTPRTHMRGSDGGKKKKF